MLYTDLFNKWKMVSRRMLVEKRHMNRVSLSNLSPVLSQLQFFVQTNLTEDLCVG